MADTTDRLVNFAETGHFDPIEQDRTDPALLEEGPPEAPPETERGQMREENVRISGQSSEEFDRQTEFNPEGADEASIWETTKHYIETDGLASNISRYVDQALTETDPDAFDEIARNIGTLMEGVSEEYEGHLLGMPTLKVAEQEADRLREQRRMEASIDASGIGTQLAGGFAGFLLDPANLVPGGVLVKGMSMSKKLATAAGMKGTHKTSAGKQIMAWSAVGGAEEAIRQIPRLNADPTYNAQQYLTDSAMGMAFAGGMVGIGSGLKGVRTTHITDGIRKAADKLSADKAYYTVAETAKAAARQTKDAPGVAGKFKAAASVKTAVSEGRVAAKERIRTKRPSMGPTARRASKQTFDAMTDGDVSRVKAAQAATLQELDTQLAKRDPAYKVPEEQSAPQTATQAVSEEAPKPKTFRELGNEALKEVEAADTAAKARIESATLDPEVKADLLRGVEETTASSRAAITDVMRTQGVMPQRTKLGNREHAEPVVDRLSAAYGSIRESAGKAQKLLNNDKVDLQKRSSVAMNEAFKSAGLGRADGESWVDALQRQLPKMSHVQRQAAVGRVQTTVSNQFGVMKREIADSTTMSAEEIAKAVDAAENIRIDAVNQLDAVATLTSHRYVDQRVLDTKWADVSDAWRESGVMGALDEDYNNLTQQTIKHQFGTLGKSLTSRLLESGAPLAQWFGHNILEAPAGYGGKVDQPELNAAVAAEMYDAQSRIPVTTKWWSTLRAAADDEGWNIARRGVNHRGNAKTHEDIERIGTDVMLEINNRMFGKPSTASQHVREMADTLTEQYSKLHDLQNGHVEGIHADNKIEHYQHQRWDDTKVLQLISNPQTKDEVIALMARGYEGAGLSPDKAEIVAQAMIEQKLAAASRPQGPSTVIGEDVVAGVMPKLEEIVEQMRRGGTPEAVIREIVAELNTQQRGAVNPGYAERRSKIDLSASSVVEGQTIRVVDLMDKDVPQTFMRYSKEATARRAISEASDGLLRSDADMMRFIAQAQQEAAHLGTTVDTVGMKNAYMMLMGRQYDGQLPMDVRRVRDAVALSRMGGLGESQLAEFGLALRGGMAGMVGLMQRVRKSTGKAKNFVGIQLSEAELRDTKMIRELEELSGLYQEMYLVDPKNVHFDAKERDTAGLSKLVDMGTGGRFRPLFQHMQTRYTGYGSIRAFEDQMAMAGITQDIARHFSPTKKAFGNKADARMRDLGVPSGKDSWLRKVFDKYVEYDENGTVISLNTHLWSQMDRNRYGVIMNRHTARVVQRGFVGESSPGMMNPWVAFLMQFKSYPMLAIEKQQARNLKFADKEAAMGVMLNTVSSATARIIRYQSIAAGIPDEKEREQYLTKKYEQDLLQDTILYMGASGQLANLYKSFSGMTDPDSNYTVADEVPVINYLDDYTEAVGSPLESDNKDRFARNTQTVMPLGTISFFNILFGAISRLMEDDAAQDEED